MNILEILFCILAGIVAAGLLSVIKEILGAIESKEESEDNSDK